MRGPGQREPCRRERQIARLMAEGLSYTEIAHVLGWTPASVRQTAHRLGDILDGPGSPVVRILRWWFEVGRDDQAA